MKVFGREPTLWVGFIAAALSLLVMFNLNGLSSDQAGLIVAVVNAVAGVVAAWRTRPISPQVYSYALATIGALLGGYGLDLSPEMLGAANLVLLAFLALLIRGQVSPTEEANKTGVLGAEAPAITRTAGTTVR